jgi:hypothetical protein
MAQMPTFTAGQDARFIDIAKVARDPEHEENALDALEEKAFSPENPVRVLAVVPKRPDSAFSDPWLAYVGRLDLGEEVLTQLTEGLKGVQQELPDDVDLPRGVIIVPASFLRGVE